ncbi:MAG TPA: hypothetical protein VMT85_12435 [Thermoanaerobaculia bacterium]|nr:hypothetical protein [Thermoanaerobaculia bacterium]
MSREITPATSLGNLRKEAKRWLKALRDGDPDARARLARAHPDAPVTLRGVQHALAREHGQESWTALKRAVTSCRPDSAAAPAALRTAEEYAQLARDFVAAFDARDDTALQRLNRHSGRTFTFDDLRAEVWRRNYAFRQRSWKVPENFLPLDEAQILVAQDAGFGSWNALMEAVATGGSPVPAYEIDAQERQIGPRRQLSEAEWDDLIRAAKRSRLTALTSSGSMNDEVLDRVAALEHLTTLDLSGSRQLTDEGLQHLARMPQLERLNLTGTKVTDRGLEVLRHLPRLRTFEMTWQRSITDAGVANLRFCDALESVDLMGSATGDGAIEALQGNPELRRFQSGREVTDAGLSRLRSFPALAALLIDGPFTNDGLASLEGLAGLTDLDLFWNVTEVTSDGFAHLVTLPNLASLGVDGRLSDDGAMGHIAEMPSLRRLRAQESAATEAGFEALGRSRTLEGFWGRECANFTARAFVAFSSMPALRSLGVGLQQVDDDALSRLPQFPALSELTPIGLQDDGFRHVGRCERLERLTCMYCRDTTDAATEHVAGLRLRYYYAGLTGITDRSLEILGDMTSLEQVELYETRGVTDAGLAFLARLPRLREVALDGLPQVTFAGTRVFPSRVRVRYST